MSLDTLLGASARSEWLDFIQGRVGLLAAWKFLAQVFAGLGLVVPVGYFLLASGASILGLDHFADQLGAWVGMTMLGLLLVPVYGVLACAGNSQYGFWTWTTRALTVTWLGVSVYRLAIALPLI